MSISVPTEPCLLRVLPGRLRIHLSSLSEQLTPHVESAICRLPGVRAAEANPLTGNVLILYDSGITNANDILNGVGMLMPLDQSRLNNRGAGEDESGQAEASNDAASQSAPDAHVRAPRVIGSGRGANKRVRIAVRGLDRDPAVSRRVVEHLQRRPGVRASASPLTGRVLVFFDEHQTDIEDLLSDVADVELPDLPAEDNPSHPLDPAPLVQSAARTAGATIGLGLIAAQQVAGVTVSTRGAAHAAGIIGIIQGFPATRNGLRTLLGRNAADLLFGGAGIVALALSGSPLGLAVTGFESLRLLTEVVARRRAFKSYAERLAGVAFAEPGSTIRLETGERTPLAATVVEGTGTTIERDGSVGALRPGASLSAGSRVHGGPFVVALQEGRAFIPQERPAPLTPTIADHYQRVLGPVSLAYALGVGVVTRSPGRILESLLLVNPRAALVGAEAASLGASAHILRAGVIVVGTRPERAVRLPGALLIDGARTLTDGLELTGTIPVDETREPADLQTLAAAVAAAAGSPWGSAFRAASHAPATDGRFDGSAATALIDGTSYTLGPYTADDSLATNYRQGSGVVMALRYTGTDIPLILFTLRPRLVPGIAEVVASCQRHGVEIGLLGQGDVALSVAQRVGVALLDDQDVVAAVRARQVSGSYVAVLSDSAESAEAFAACDLAIGLTSGRSARFPARADLLAPDLAAVVSIIEAGAQREATARDSVALSVMANVAGAIWGIRGGAGIQRASIAVYGATLAAMADGWARLRGGSGARSTLVQLADPRPERWGARSVADTLAAFHSSENGLTNAQAAQRRQETTQPRARNGLVRAALDQARSPLIGIMAVGAGLALVLGSPLDFVIIGATVGVNVAVGVWQERRAGQAAAALERMGAATARVLRDDTLLTVPATELVPGDIIVLAPGDRVAADARLIEARNLEVDEAALTGESLPVTKVVCGGTDANRVVLDGSDVTVGSGRAVVVATGKGTRLGATAAALALDEMDSSPLGMRLSQMLRQILPLAAAGGTIVVGAGVLRGQALLPQLALGASLAIAAVPEGLPLLAGVGQAAVANRLAWRRALVRRLTAVEALGRVDVACTDKTGTLTEGRLALTLVADVESDASPLDSAMMPGLRDVLRAAALASPHPDAVNASAHPTDVAVVRGAEDAGLNGELRAERTAEAPFDPVRSFHATISGGSIFIKGAPEAVLPRCGRVRCGSIVRQLDDDGCQKLRCRAEDLAGRGLRVLMVAEGAAAADNAVDDPRHLIALGFVGISDPLRPDVPAVVRRCRAAGVRVMMLTGDSPETARAIARQAGLLDSGEVLTGADIAHLRNGDLGRRLENATVIARVTPLDKLRIVESLQQRGHVVAMTGDGVNDAPALRLADVGVAMGHGGTEVARQAADVVLADDEFATLVDALVEGRSFWRNIRRALGLLLGGNLGELGLVVGASVLGVASPLVTRQILVVNLITDALPALAVALQRPADRNLAGLAREGAAALDRPLRDDVLRRGISTMGPSLAAYLIALGAGSLPQARSVAFASIVSTQLAQTLAAGRSENGLTRSVLGAVAGSTGLLAATLTVPALRELLLLATPTPLGWALILAGAPLSVALNHLLASSQGGELWSGLPKIDVAAIPPLSASPA